ncbi:phosphatase PAP2 family protein [Microbacterium sp. ARD31]|uniref:phosphatase PAP2 family protein n=1 Tax=Microbacterium sp. ARD31 TaxID=2962576 RepID=UPI00288125D0|nr:phosphatase PAP2 family protein [Microbacterium sp. ARD31]MDT0182936.1 phosphatase PAP2 family protein [Microbacterium sp. ARD31]
MSLSTSHRAVARTLAAVWAVLVLAVLAVGWVITGPLESTVDPWDDSVERSIAAERTADLDVAAAIGSGIADTIIGVGLAVVVAGLAAWRLRSWRPVVYFTVLVAGYLALYVIVTHLVTRDRPPVEILDPGLIPDHSYPSGHVATSIVVYGGIALWVGAVAPRWRPWIWPLFLAPLVVAPSRLYQGAHHPTDVMASLVFATVWLVVVSRVLLPQRSGDDEGPQNSEVPRSARGLPSGS